MKHIWIVRYEDTTADGKERKWFDRVFSSKKKALNAVSWYKINCVPAYESRKRLE